MAPALRRLPRRFPLAAGWLALAATAAAETGGPWTVSEAVGLGPLLLRPQSPFSVLRYSPLPLPPAIAPAGVWHAGWVINWNNYFAVDPGGRYIVDAEALSLTLGVSHALSARTEVAVSVPVSYRGGGILDGFVEGFERAVGVPNEERKRHPRDRFLVRVVGDDGTVFQRTGSAAGWGLEDMVVRVRYQLARGSKSSPAVLVYGGWKVPVGREHALRSTGGSDLALGVAAGQKLGRFHLYGSASAIQFAPSRFGSVSLARRQWSLFAGTEFCKSPRTSWLLQAAVTSPAAPGFADFGKRTWEVTLGFKRVLTPDLLFEASVLENLFVFDNSPDVGFHLGLVWRSTGGAR